MSVSEGVFLVAPTEPRVIKTLGRTSSIPEQYGVDILFFAHGKFAGVQRKELSDLVASVYDGRLSKELGMMKRLSSATVLVEGRPAFTTEGELVHPGARITKVQLYSVVYSIQLEHGVAVGWTIDERDTVEAVYCLRRWLQKAEHRSLLQRPKPQGPWGHLTSRDWGLYLLQGFPGVGAELAGRIFDYFGRVPLSWDCTPEELMEVEGVGPKRADSLFRALGAKGVETKKWAKPKQ